ncbi:hypothetical protein E1H12_09860 [Geitlerinema sp. P-1104]|uniref:hypothetical protein n=1 Tax=Geitlerinema sp. P-1104 TaxID=2546230 RepID=UPI001476F6C0|nr:hypothetical protein [Geitlerinema sp. P-1104]NMG58823.1 hypothetical protein [Geitlerinema sp. P-1104]
MDWQSLGWGRGTGGVTDCFTYFSALLGLWEIGLLRSWQNELEEFGGDRRRLFDPFMVLDALISSL